MVSFHGLTSREGFGIDHEKMKNQMMFTIKVEKHKFKITILGRSYA
jgi:hypothetical protein